MAIPAGKLRSSFKQFRRRPGQLLAVAVAVVGSACTQGGDKAVTPVDASRTTASATLHGLCESLTKPRIETVAPGVHVAVGYDLANTILIETPEGHVTVDAGISPAAAKVTKAALLAKVPGKIRALIYTHSHLDHVGGASAWLESGAPEATDGAAATTPEIWASANFVRQFFKQYGLFQPLEQMRAGRQYGEHVSRDLLPCTGIGPLPNLQQAAQSGARMPTRTFSGSERLSFGDVHIDLMEANGETPDQILIWLPEKKVAITGDNIYRAFPNLYTIRGTSPRPVDEWIESLDKVRRLQPEALVPSHTAPVQGAAKIAALVTSYRDGIQWVRDATVRGANAGLSAVSIADHVKLPPHLAQEPYLEETYGQADWSARAIYTNEIGWFAGDADQLYPLRRTDAVTREVALMGGPEAVLNDAEKALSGGDPRWAAHLLAKLRDMGDGAGGVKDKAQAALARAYDELAKSTFNTNGRAYLAEVAGEMRSGPKPRQVPRPDADLLREVPLGIFFRSMAVRLRAEDALDVHEAVRFVFPDRQQAFTLTIRRGIAELAEGEPIPGTPEPLGTLTVDSFVWKQLAVKQISIAGAVSSGSLKVDGSLLGVATFLRRFDLD